MPLTTLRLLFLVSAVSLVLAGLAFEHFDGQRSGRLAEASLETVPAADTLGIFDILRIGRTTKPARPLGFEPMPEFSGAPVRDAARIATRSLRIRRRVGPLPAIGPGAPEILLSLAGSGQRRLHVQPARLPPGTYAVHVEGIATDLDTLLHWDASASLYVDLPARAMLPLLVSVHTPGEDTAALAAAYLRRR